MLWVRIYFRTFTISEFIRLKSYLGSCSVRHGYILTIFKIESIENGVITDQGDVVFRVVFKTLVFRPIQGSVIDAVVEKVDQAGVELSIGAVELFVARMVF